MGIHGHGNRNGAVFWILVIVAIIALVRSNTGNAQASSVLQPPPRYTESPEQLLATRFARGDIDEAEYQQRLAVLRGGSR